MDASKTPLAGTAGKTRKIDDNQPRAQIRKLYYGKEITSSDERKIEEFSTKYVVAERLVREYILHLEHLEEKAYKDDNWRQLCETRQIKGFESI